MGVPSRIGQRATTLILVAAFALFAVPAVGLATGRVRVVPVVSGSMDPSITAGSAVVVTRERPDEVRVGQVIVYAIPVGDEHTEVHRVVSVAHHGSNPVVVTKGDANQGPDPWQAELLGDSVWRVRTSVPVVGRVILWVGSPFLLLSCLVISVSAFVIVGLRRIWGQVPSGSLEGAVDEPAHV
jgi:signal peptidase I